MAYETLNFLQNATAVPDPDGSVVQTALARAAIEDRAEAAAAQRAADAKRQTAEERAESLAVMNHHMGDPVGNLSRARAALSEADDEVASLRDKLARAESRQAGAEDITRHWRDQLLVADECTTRSRHPDPAEQATLRANDAMRSAHEAEFTGYTTLRKAREQQQRWRGRAAKEPPAAQRSDPHADQTRYRNGGHITEVS